MFMCGLQDGGGGDNGGKVLEEEDEHDPGGIQEMEDILQAAALRWGGLRGAGSATGLPGLQKKPPTLSVPPYNLQFD